MSYKSILVHFDIDRPVEPLAKAAAGLARRFGARLIGFSAAAVPPPVALPEGIAYDGSLWAVEQSEIEKRFAALKEEFASIVGGGNGEWRQSVSDPTRTLATTARVADLVLLAAPSATAGRDVYRAADAGSLVLQAGRPILVVAEGASEVALKKVVIAWKDTREARRAVADAAPILAAADEVVVASVDREPDQWLRESVADVAAFAAAHGAKVKTEVIRSRDDVIGLAEFISGARPDVVVSGAYGHSRLREWAFGGVTRSLLGDGSISRLMAS